MTSLASLGVQIKSRTFHTRTIKVGQVDVSNEETTRFELELPKKTELRVKDESLRDRTTPPCRV